MINVVYLAYFNEALGYDIDFLNIFMDSYKQKKAGINNSLTIIVKNCSDRVLFDKVYCLAKENNARVIELPDDGWDFGAYFRVSELIDSEYVFFCGGFIKILSENWLLNLYNSFKMDSLVQLAGPMGSWGDVKDEKFPNYHIRTSAFMLKRQLFLDYAATQKFPVTKEDTYGFEHGENSLTNFILNKGYKAVVVDCDGKVFTPEKWDESKTFRDPNVSKSMLADRHVAYFETQESSRKELLSRVIWGRSLKPVKINIFVLYPQNNLNISLYSEIFQPISLGAFKSQNGICCLKDNIGDNISSKYNYYKELTGHYWIWKNLLPKLNTEYIGFVHKDRFLDFDLSEADGNIFKNTILSDFKKRFGEYTEEKILKCIDNCDILLPQKFYSPKPIYDLYLDSSPKEEIDLALNIIKEFYPNYIEAAQKILSGNELYACLIFVMKKELIAEYMEWIFNILTILEQQIDWTKYDESSSGEILVNIAEIFFNIWLLHSTTNRNLSVKETSGMFLESCII